MVTESQVIAHDQRFKGAWDSAELTQNGGATVQRQVVCLGDWNTMSYLSGNAMLDISTGKTGFSHVNKFGENTDVDTAEEDVWTGGGTWVAPTTARIHQIVSTSTDDASGGVGAKTLRVYGLTGWGTAEVSEDISMDGTTNVPTVNSYVIIHRMQVLTKGASGPNVGTITATADTDGTVTARIEAADGQTLMTIYGVPSVQTLYLTKTHSSVQKAQSASIDLRLLVNPEPDAELTGFLVKQVWAVSSGGLSFSDREFEPYFTVPGPAIVKISANSSALSASVSAGFDGILETN